MAAATYTTGKPCPRGHFAPRYKSNRACTKCLREKDAARKNRNGTEAAKTRKRRWEKNNPERLKEIKAATYRRHRDKWRAWNRNRRARIKGNGGEHKPEDLENIFRAQNGRCAYHRYCGSTLEGGFEVDHIVPITAGGTNAPENLQLTCTPCNRSKGALMPREFLERLENGY